MRGTLERELSFSSVPLTRASSKFLPKNKLAPATLATISPTERFLTLVTFL